MPDSDTGETRVACSTDAVTEGSPEIVEIEGDEIAIFHTDGEYFAITNTCPHQGGPLGAGKVEDECVYCPWHGWQFDLETGDHVHGKKTTPTYDVVVDGDELHLIL